MSRREFTKATKRLALKRSGGFCEGIDTWYGLYPGQRCNASLSHGVEFDHIDLDANSKDNSLANAAAVCIRCHKFKTAHHDIPVAAKTLRQQDKDNGIKSRRSSLSHPKLKRRMDGQVVSRRTGKPISRHV